MRSSWNDKIPPVFIFALAAFAALPWSILFALSEAPTLSFVAFDVGQGDAILIETPDHYQVLIDGGPGDAILEKLAGRMHFWDREIDLLVLTHPHADHIAGLISVVRRYQIGAVIDADIDYGTAEYAEWEKNISSRRIPRHTARSGMRARVGKYAELFILSPADVPPESPKNIHDVNVASELRFGEVKFILMGDAEARLERLLLAKGLLPDVSVLKVGHHGSKTSSSAAMLAAVKPETAVVSAGKRNRYGHPAKEVLDRIEAAGASVLRTDLLGDIVLETDGKNVYQSRK